MSQPQTALPIVLIVDDDALTRRMIEAAVSKANYQVRSVGSGDEAIEFMRKVEPDLILLDVQMPGMDGFEVCEKVRQFSSVERLPIIMLTGREDMESIDRAFAAGATDFISKPINWQLLIQRIRFALRSRDLYINLQANEERLQQAQRMARLIYWELDIRNNQVNISSNLQEIFNIDPASINSLDDLCEYMSSEDEIHLRNLLTRTFKTGKYSMEHTLSVPQLGDRIVLHQGEVIETYEGMPVRFSSTIQDITETRNAEETIRYQTYYDTLTGLPNRRMFEENLMTAMEMANSNEHMLALILVGLDKIKFINDSLGHHAGDKVLVHMSQRLKRIPYASQMTARFEGDVFAMLYEGLGSADEPEEVAKSILATISEPCEVEGHDLFITASIGISLYPLDDNDEHSLLKNADAAFWRAKQEGGNQYRYFSVEHDSYARERVLLEKQMRNAYTNGEFLLHYQPQIDAHNGQVMGVEALVRWNHPENGMVPPMHFIPLAEETGFIRDLGEWVMLEACRQVVEWREQGLADLRVGVNISPRQFMYHEELIRVVQRALSETGIAPQQLDVEITETTAMADVDKGLQTLAEIRAMGVQISLDDFGTGYSSLGFLQRLPIHTLKIDRAFVKDIDAQGNNGVFARAIIAMAHGLGLHVIAEGIETEAQHQYLARQGADEIQGFYFSKPLPAAELVEFLSSSGGLVKKQTN